jgi:hypothetical protein
MSKHERADGTYLWDGVRTFVSRQSRRVLVLALAAGTGLVLGCSTPSSGPGPESAEVTQRQLDNQSCQLTCAADLSVCRNICSNQAVSDGDSEVCDGACSGDDQACYSGCRERGGSSMCCSEACIYCPI